MTLLLAALLALPPAAAAESAARATAGAHLSKVVAATREKYADAELVRISGRTGASGEADCDPADPGPDGWRFEFYSADKDAFLLVSECRGATVGPMTELLDGASAAQRRAITGRFLDSDEAIRAIAKAGFALEPRGRRPFSLSLLRVDDPRFRDAPVFWQVDAGEETYFVNASTRRVERGVLVRAGLPLPPAGEGGGEGK